MVTIPKHYECGRVQFSGDPNASYDRHLLFDYVVDPARATPRERFEAVARAVRDLLARLGVPLVGEIEVWEVPDEEHPHLYGGWYMVIGQLLSRPPEEAREFTMAGWRMSWSSGPSYEVSQFAGEEVCELHFLLPVGDFIAPEVAPAERGAAPDRGGI